MVAEKQALIKYIRSDAVTLNAYPSKKEANPVSKYLFGKFTEHLGRNIYEGMWAQILKNPSFEPCNFFGKDNAVLEQRLSLMKEAIPTVKILESFHDGVAYYWAKYGEGDVIYAVVPECVGSWTSQKIDARSLKTGKAGIQQPIFLPLHRENIYELSLWVKGDAKRVTCAVETLEDNRILGEKVITSIEAGRWEKKNVSFKVSKEGVDRGQPLVFSISLTEPGMVLLDHCFLFPADNLNGFDPDVVRLFKEANLTLLRYPGGNFVSQYNWKDGVGPVEKRPIRFNKAWNMAEYNHVGTDEFMKFCSLVGCEPLICVNAGDGKPEEAAQWVEYCNGNVDTVYGKLRAENGNPEPYQVKFWEIGNELYGPWQEGYCSAEEYAERYERFYRSMIKVDPGIKFIANGYDLDWNEKVIARKGSIIRSLSIHPLIGGRLPKDIPPEDVYHSIIGFTYWSVQYLEQLKNMMLKAVREPKLAVTELQIMTGPRLPNNKTLTEALYYSGIVNASIQHGDFVEMITHSALVNHGGGLRKEKEIVYADPVYYAQKLYAKHCIEQFPVKLVIETPMFDVPELQRLPKVRNVPYIDAIALLDKDEKTLSLIVSNRKPDTQVKAKIYLHDFEAYEKVKTETLSGPSYMAVNTMEKPDRVKIFEDEDTILAVKLEHVFQPHSITALIFKNEK